MAAVQEFVRKSSAEDQYLPGDVGDFVAQVNTFEERVHATLVLVTGVPAS